MKLLWEDSAWDDYIYWQIQDRKTLKKINSLLTEIKRTPFNGLGKAEPLKGDLSGLWSRRIDDKNRLVYFIKDSTVYIVSCRGHYNDK